MAGKRKDLTVKPRNELGIDLATAGTRYLMDRLEKMAATWDVDGPYPYREDRRISQIHLTTTWTERQLDEWLYRIELPQRCHIYGTFTREEAA
ncbi:hypothetical protein HNR62_000329 [Oceanisphaera litoralis]|uniref:hypothetical protein n=1 Tax=Oceanisphaera litoralis TaxID=225144 RepID=UPI00195EEF07|nr:hypothetical protein [Oceanisphaera litoralis]MBM7454500.1 hypothetical protein [Oceanisphaera litoralis]